MRARAVYLDLRGVAFTSRLHSLSAHGLAPLRHRRGPAQIHPRRFSIPYFARLGLTPHPLYLLLGGVRASQAFVWTEAGVVINREAESLQPWKGWWRWPSARSAEMSTT